MMEFIGFHFIVNKMNKKIITLLIGILLVGTVIAGTSIIQNVVIPAKVHQNKTVGLIRFKCDGVDMNFTIKEKGEWKDDAYDGANKLCDGEVTLIKDWNDRVMKEYEGIKSFDEKELNIIKAEAEKEILPENESQELQLTNETISH